MDKKLIIGSMISIALLFGVFLITGYIKLPFYSVDRGDGLGCINMLSWPECYSGKSITYLGKPAVGFNLPAGTEIHAPFDGVFFEDTVLYEEEDSIELDRFTRARFGIVNTPSFIVFVGEHNPAIRGGESVVAGDVVATITEASEMIDEESGSNFVIYAEEYDLLSLFK